MVIQFDYNGKKYPWTWQSMRTAVHLCDRSGVQDWALAFAHVDDCLMGTGTNIERLKWIEHIAHAGFFAADRGLHAELGEKGVDAILSDPTAFPAMVANIMASSDMFVEQTSSKKKSRMTLRNLFKKAGKVFAS